MVARRAPVTDHFSYPSGGAPSNVCAFRRRGDVLEVCGIIGPMKKVVPGPGCRSVWDYTRPPRVEPCLLYATRSFCDYKGEALYGDIHDGTRTSIAAAWSYPSPDQPFSTLRNHLAFHPHRVEGRFVDGERFQPQEGDFYGGWITSNITGPFKGGSGTRGW